MRPAPAQIVGETEGPSLDAERLLIGVCLADPHRQPPAATLRAEMFRCPLQGAIWEAILSLTSRNTQADLIAVSAQLEQSGKAPLFAASGGIYAYLAGAAAAVTAAEVHCVDSAVASVREAFVMQQIRMRWESAEPARAGSPQQAAAALRRLAEEAEQLTPARGFRTIAEKVRAIWSEPPPQLIPTGLASLDRALGGGLLPCGLSVLVAGTGRGKTGLAIQLALEWVRQGRSVLYLATEMDERQIIARVLAQTLGLPWLTVYHQGTEHLAQLAAWAGDCLATLRCEPLSPHESLDVLLSDWRRDQPGRPLAIVLDHLTDAARGRSGSDMRHATQAVTGELKRFARLHGLPILAVAQTARTVTQPDRGRQPRRSGRDFEGAAKDAGEVEADAEALLYLDSDPCPQDGSAPVRLHLSKSRGSACNLTIALRFHGALGIFTEDAEDPLQTEAQSVLAAIDARRAAGQPTSLRALKSALRIGQTKLSELLMSLEQQKRIVNGPGGWRVATEGSRP